MGMTMKKELSIILLASIIYLGFTGCGKRCEDFNNDILKWMPYKINDRIILQKNEISDTLKVIQSEIYHTDKIGAWVKCDCEDSYSIDLSSDSLEIHLTFFKSNNVSESYVYLNNENLTFHEQENTFTFNSRTYSNVIIYKNFSQSHSKRFDSLLLSKSIGIIGIIGTTEEWTIYDDSIRNIDVSSINFENIDC